MPLFTVALTVVVLTADTVTLEERIDLFEPNTMAFLGSERTWFGADGRRLRLEVTDASGGPTLLFFLRHDDMGRESEAIYFESDADVPSREVFTYTEEGRLQTTTYYYEPGQASDRTEAMLDERGRELRKRYYRADGSQYGAEDVLWNDNGNKLGWDFRYVGREGGASFRYVYDAVDQTGEWTRRTRTRDGRGERIEVRTRVTGSSTRAFATPAVFAPGHISTERSETSPSFSADGQTMVFARYGNDWNRKDAFIAYGDSNGWRPEPLVQLGKVYNLAISPDGRTVIYATNVQDVRTLYRIRRLEAGWSEPQNLSKQFGLVGTYPCMTDDGDLIFYDSDGRDGAGIYSSRRVSDGFAAPTALYVPTTGDSFDACATNLGSPLLVTQCFDGVCDSGPKNGVWKVQWDQSGVQQTRKLPNILYTWGAQLVESLGLIVVTDGEDILMLPLSVGLAVH